MKVISNTIFSLPIISMQLKQQRKILIIQFLAIVCLFPAISCKQPPMENICDPYSKANLSTILLKFISSDSSAYCGINCTTLVNLQRPSDESIGQHEIYLILPIGMLLPMATGSLLPSIMALLSLHNLRNLSSIAQIWILVH